MREILFRAKGLYKDIWYYGNFVECKRNLTCEIVDLDENETNLSRCVRRETLGQYIGLIDKNGKKIFMGDIVEVWVERNIQGRKQSNQDTLVKARAVVDYGETFCNIAYYLNYDNNYNKKITQPKNKEYYDRDIQQRPIHCFTQQRIKEYLEQNNKYWKGTNERFKKMAEIEVIGNVWDNKDLLEGK